MYATLGGIYSIQYIIMWCLVLMENQWRDKPATAETIQKQFLNWHMEGLCDWFWLPLDFNTIHCGLIDSQTSSCGLSANCQMSPCHLLLLSLIFSFHLLSLFSGPLRHRERMCCVRLGMLDKWLDDFPQIHAHCNQSVWDVLQFIHISTPQSNPRALAQILHVQSAGKVQH